jgi:hypothetical protein
MNHEDDNEKKKSCRIGYSRQMMSVGFFDSDHGG